ncbi:S-formylglutathione hydrolase-like [Panonychus citri]|uniref:S-formylglutathione hydrolase-like n=1 Tax=Panonychus citri TaxID=50023 RepID=UPI002307268F|nr:S-formylglutathione hydrolase-like [Panonychus citri]
MSSLKEISSIKLFNGYQKRYSHYSFTNDWEMKFSIYLPPKALKGDQCPVMLWLTGRTLGEWGFTNKSGIQRFAAKEGIIIAAPEPTPRGIEVKGEDGELPYGSQFGYYVDSTVDPWSKHYQMYSYIVNEFYQLLTSTNFPVKSNLIGLSGHSMGGTAAIPIALRNPDKFVSVTSMSGDYNPIATEGGSKILSTYLGENKDNWENYDSTKVINSYTGPERTIFVDLGGSDPVLDDFSQAPLLKACRGTNISLDYRIRHGYHHAYEFIQTFIEDHLLYHKKIFSTLI